MTAKDFEREVAASQGKPGTYPGDIHFTVEGEGKTIKAELVGGFDKKDFRRLDPWTLAYLIELEGKCEGAIVQRVVLSLNPGTKKDRQFDLNFESLRRRASFLALNNPEITLELVLDERPAALYDKESLLHQSSNEVLRSSIPERSEEGAPNLLEKAFQSFLYGKGMETRTNDRLAILGEDFYQMKGKEVGILREFPTGAFDSVVSDATRITPTESIDLVTQNKWGNLALVELKVDNSELEVISQILDYGLYVVRYRDLIARLPEVARVFNEDAVRHADIFCYVANNRFHPRFVGIQMFYHVGAKSYGFCLKRIALGETTEI